jgi:EAL domain-containing protein (putative c-di-GMP-specific phosphodiesterase class I)
MSDRFSSTPNALPAGAPASAAETQLVFQSLTAFTFGQRLATLSSVLDESDIENRNFRNGPALRAELARHIPDIIFIDVASTTTEIIDILFAVSQGAYSGPVQLMCGRGVPGDVFQHTGECLGLQMLPPLVHPVEEAELVRVLEAEGLREAAAARPRVGLEEALRQGWIEFWYQPKIELRKRRLAGVELLARVRHPDQGILSPGSFMADADEQSLLSLNQAAILAALQTGRDIARMGAKLRFAVNVSGDALRRLPIPAMIEENRPKVDNWPGLLFDVTEKDITKDFRLVHDLTPQLTDLRVGLAIDDYGRGGLTMGQLRQLEFAELKLSQSFVAGCHVDPAKATICEKMIGLVHKLGRTVVAIGVERAAEVAAIEQMGFDIGQGFVFGQPMPHDRFIGLLRERLGQMKRTIFAARVAAAYRS